MFKMKLLITSLIIGCVVTNIALAAANKQTVPNNPQATTAPVTAPQRVVMVKLNGHEYTVIDYVNFLQRNQEYVKGAMSSDEGKAEAIRALIGSGLIREVMIKDKELLPLGEKSTPQDLSHGYEKLAAKKFPIPPVADEKILFDYYQEHQQDFGIPDSYRLSQIQFRVPPKATPPQIEAAKTKAEDALKRLESGEDFGSVAEKLTENPLAKLPKGDIGYARIDNDPFLKEAVGHLKVGDRTGILKSAAGFEILKLTDMRPGIVTPFPNAREQVVRVIRDREQTKLLNAYVRELAKTAKIEVIQPELKPLFPNGVFPEK